METNQHKEPMEQESVVEIETDNETVNTENADLREAQSRFLKHWESYKQYGRKTTVEGWHCGGALEEVCKNSPHGEWGKWLESHGITRSTADRLRLLSKSYDIHQVGEFDSVDQALAASSKRKKAGKKVEPEVKTEGEASSGTPEEANGEGDPPQLADDTESTQEIQELRETEDQLPPVGDKETAKLRETKDQLLDKAWKEVERLQEENKLLKRLLKENGIPWESTPDDQYTRAA